MCVRQVQVQLMGPVRLEMTRTTSLAVADMLLERLRTSYSQHCAPLVAIYWSNFPTRSHSLEGSSRQHIFCISDFFTYPLPFDTLNKGDPLDLSLSYLVGLWKN